MAGTTSLIHIAAARLGAIRMTVATASLASLCFAGCANKAPTHDGYAVGTSNQGPSRPWARAAEVKLDARGKLTTEISLSYPKRARAKWLALELPANGELTLTLDVFPTSGVRVPVTLELYDATMARVYTDKEAAAASRAAAATASAPDEAGFVEEAPEPPADEPMHDADASPQYTFKKLAAGRYVVHVFVSRRLDAATVELDGKFSAGAGPVSATAPALVVADVALLPSLPLVPVADDAPGARGRDKPRTSDVRKSDKKTPRKPAPVATPEPETAPTPAGPPRSARIINVSVVPGGTEITVNRGTDHGLQVGVAGEVVGVKQGAFALARCAPRTCKATVKATPAQLAAASKVTLAPQAVAP